MTGDQTASAVYALLCIVLVASGLAARRLPWGQTLKMAAAWVAIFAVGAVVFSFRTEIMDRVLERPVLAGGTLRVPMSEDGHFHVVARINGKPVRLLIDSGASVTTLGRSAAAATDVEPDGMFPVMVNTANGTIQVRRGRVRSIEVGDIAMDDLPVHLAPGDDIDVIGMNFLSRLSRWSVEGRTLVLVP